MTQVVCSACGGTNRLPEDRNAADARCGRCRQALFTAQATEVDGGRLQAHLRGARGVAVLVDVWAPWCGPCRTMAPQFAAAAARLEPAVRLLKLNSEAFPADAAALNIRSIPTLILFRDGREIARRSGALGVDQIVSWTQQALARESA